MYLSKIWSAGGIPETAGRMSSGSRCASPYTVSSVGVTTGLSRLRWQVQQVTTCRPLKFCLLMACTMVAIRRAVRFLGVSTSQCSLSWHSPQHMLRAAENRPIVPMNSSTGIPVSTCTFLKTSCDICGFSADPACGALAVNAIPITQTTVIAATARTNGLDHIIADCGLRIADLLSMIFGLWIGLAMNSKNQQRSAISHVPSVISDTE